MIEFVGENWEYLKNIHDVFQREPARKDRILRVVNPFESATFEPSPMFWMIDFFSTYILAKFYPKTYAWRMQFRFITKYELTMKIPGYKLFNPQKRLEFEKMLRIKFKPVTFIS